MEQETSNNMIFTEENKVYQIDCRKALWATDKLNEIYHDAKVQLSDVDFIIETDDRILLVEYKNANIAHAVKPEAFNTKDNKLYDRLARKYYDSLFYLQLVRKNKPKYFTFVVEFPNDDIVIRKYMRSRLKGILPFELQKLNGSEIKLIEECEVCNIAEWNEKYVDFPISKNKSSLEKFFDDYTGNVYCKEIPTGESAGKEF